MLKKVVFVFHCCVWLCLPSLHGSSSLPGCDPEVRQALDEAAVQGIQRSTHTVHEAYSRPESTFDLSCLEDYMSGLNGFSFLIDPGKLLGNFLFTPELIGQPCSINHCLLCLLLRELSLSCHLIQFTLKLVTHLLLLKLTQNSGGTGLNSPFSDFIS